MKQGEIEAKEDNPEFVRALQDEIVLFLAENRTKIVRRTLRKLKSKIKTRHQKKGQHGAGEKLSELP